MTSPYRIEITDTAQGCFDELGPKHQSELTACFEMLARGPFPGADSKVVRLRTSPPTPTPCFYVATKSLGVLFCVDGELVEILVIEQRPVLG